MSTSSVRIACFALLLALPALADATVPATLRVDLMHTGNATGEAYSLERVVIEPLPWPGPLDRTLDEGDRGLARFEVSDPKTGKLLYSRGYSTIFGEWRTTEEALTVARGFQESLRFPRPEHPVRVRVLHRGADNAFAEAWHADIDPAALDVIHERRPAPAKPIAIRVAGDPADKVDLLILGDGYTTAELGKFEADARRLSDHLFKVSPFKERAGDFNVWALTVPTRESGISRPSTGAQRDSTLNTRYDVFGSERYVLTLDNRALRELAQYAPYEFVEILVNNETYGGGGIFGQFSTAAAGNDWAEYLFVHEFGHHFAGLADEYYTSSVAYISGEERPEPWEPNATATTDRAKLKWRRHVRTGTPLPTPWPKAEYEAYQRDYQAKRAALRKANRPESEMNALFKAERAFTDDLLRGHKNYELLGAFEGANYQAKGYYRPAMQCLMFSRSDSFCQVCQDAISDVIDLYSRPVR
jgi:hypothetical protein